MIGAINDIIIKRHFVDLMNQWHKVEEPKLGFNAFSLMSDLYRRENFHSDILASFLDRNGDHGEGSLFFDLFADMLNRLGKGSVIDKIDFSNYRIEREKNRIDILIFDEKSKKAIIVENKINNAVDMEKQLLRYHEICKDNELETVAIVYWRLDRNKKPNMGNWAEDEKKMIENKLVYLDTVNEREINFVDHFLKLALLKTNKNDVVSVLRQYITLLEYLDGTKKTYYIMDKFYNFLLENDNFQTLLSAKKMMEEFPEYLAEKIVAEYQERCRPFDRTWVYAKNIAVFEGFEYKDTLNVAVVECRFDFFLMQFFSRTEEVDYTEEILGKIGIETEIIGDRHSIRFDQSELQERVEKLYSFIDSFLEKLKEMDDN